MQDREFCVAEIHQLFQALRSEPNSEYGKYLAQQLNRALDHFRIHFGQPQEKPKRHVKSQWQAHD